VLHFNRNEWEAFLEEFSELTKKYEFVLSRLELAEKRVEDQQQTAKQLSAKSRESLRQIMSAIEKICKETEDVLNESG